MTIHHRDDRVTLHHGDALDVLRTLPDASVDSVVTDPPYGLEFMGKEWDAPWKDNGRWTEGERGQQGRIDGRGGMDTWGARPKFAAGLPFQQWCELWAAECLRVLKPGGHLLAFGGTRTWHRLACAVEDAGFEVRDSIAWLYGSGFPKSLDVSKAIDKAAGAEREVIGTAKRSQNRSEGWDRPWMREQMEAVGGSGMAEHALTAPATDAAREWAGWGTALKPAFEPVVVARKPLTGTVAANVTTHGTGALNIDGCRIEGGERPLIISKSEDSTGILGNGLNGSSHGGSTTSGRWPANVILDSEMAGVLDEQSGTLTSGKMKPTHTTAGVDGRASAYGKDAAGGFTTMETYGDSGGASRFFYVAKAPKKERPVVDGVAHPTVKPLALMRWLVRLVTPPGGTVLEPFAGSGTTVEACLLEGFQCIAIEKGDEYLPLILARINRQREQVPEVEQLTRRTDPEAAIVEQVREMSLFELDGEGA